MSTNNNLYIESLVDFILDQKPYHSKLTEVIQELQFFDKINVKITDHHEISTHLSSIWDKIHYSDGWRKRFMLPPIFAPRYSSETNLFKFDLAQDEISYLKEPSTFNLPNTFQFGSSQGIESTYLNNEILIEGLDYWISKGAYTFNVNTDSNIPLLKLTNVDEWSKCKALYNDFSGNPHIKIKNIEVTPTKESWWKINVEKKIHYIEQKTRKTSFIVDVQKSLDNIQQQYSFSDMEFYDAPFYEVYYNNKITIPKNVILLPDNKIQFDFLDTKAKVVRVINGGNKAFDIQDNLPIWEINHNLNTTNFLYQAYFLNDDGNYEGILPQKVQIIDENNIKLFFSTALNGKVVLRFATSKKFSLGVDFTVEQYQQNLLNGITLSKLKEIDIFNNYTNFQVYENGLQEIPSENYSYVIRNNGYLRLKFNDVVEGQINYTFNNIEYYYKVTNQYTGETIGYGFENIPFESEEVKFTIDFKSDVEIDEYSILRPENNIAIKSNSTNQLWSIFKINPIPFKIENNSAITITDFNAQREYVKLIPYAPSFVNTNRSKWHFIFTANKHFEIKKYLPYITQSGEEIWVLQNTIYKPIKLGPWYENDEIKIKIVNPKLEFDASRAYDEDYLGWYTNKTFVDNIVAIDDEFTFEVLDKKPNYLVYGSESKNYEFATIGEYFWNGEIGFMPAAPYYSVNGNYFLNPYDYQKSTGYFYYDQKLIDISEYEKQDTFDESFYDSDFAQSLAGKNAVSNNKYWFLQEKYPLKWNIKQGTLLLPKNDGNYIADLGLELYEPPRFDAFDERFDIFINNVTKNTDDLLNFPDNQFFVTSSMTGQLPSAVLNYKYSNFETTKVSTGYHNSGAVNFRIFSDAETQLDPQTSFTIEIKSNFIKPFHSKDVIILNSQEPKTGLLKVNTINFDKLAFHIYNDQTARELGNYFEDSSIIPTFIRLSKLNPYFLNYHGEQIDFGTTFDLDQHPANFNKIDSYDLLLNNSPNSKVGTISSVYDPYAKLNRQVIDISEDFVNQYLPLNTKLKFTSVQTDEYNHQVGALVTETLKWSEKIKFSDTINIKVIDSNKYEGYDEFDYMYSSDWAPYDYFIKYESLLNLKRKDVIPGESQFTIDIKPPFVIKQERSDSLQAVISDTTPELNFEFPKNKPDQVSNADINENLFSVVSRYISADTDIPNLALFNIPIYYGINDYELILDGFELYEKMYLPEYTCTQPIYSATIELMQNLTSITAIKKLNGVELTKYSYDVILKNPVKTVSNSSILPLDGIVNGITLTEGDRVLFTFSSLSNIYVYTNGNFIIEPSIIKNSVVSSDDYSHWIYDGVNWTKFDYQIIEIRPKVFEILFLGEPQPVIFYAN